MNVFGIGCHPDDLRVSLGGTLTKNAKQGHKAPMYHIANGSGGNKVIQSEKFNIIKPKGTEEAAKTLGTGAFSLDIDDADVVVSYLAQDVSSMLTIPYLIQGAQLRDSFLPVVFMGRIIGYEYKFS